MILPERIDDAELCNSIEIWNEMLLDPTIAGIRLWMNVNTLNDGFSFEPAAFEPDMGQDNPNEADMKEADWAHRYVNYAIKRLKYVDRDIMLVLWDLLDGARIPHKLAEVTFDTVKYGEYAGLPAIASVRTKPRQNYNLVFDTMNRFRGIVGIVPGGSIAKWSGYIFDVSAIPNAIAAEKCLLFYIDDRDGIPRSLYNSAYAPWGRLMSLYIDLMETSRGMTGGKSAVILSDKAGQVFQDPATGENINAFQAVESQASVWGNNGYLIVPNGVDVKVFFPGGDALDAFVKAIKMCKAEMSVALTTTDKSIMEGEHSSGLSESTSSDDAQPVIELLKSRLCLCLDKLAYNLLLLAKGEEYAQRYCPTSTMKRGDVADFPASGATIAAMGAAGVITPSQWIDICKLGGYRPPSQMEMEKIGLAWLAKQDQAQNPPEPVSASPKEPIGKDSDTKKMEPKRMDPKK